MNNFESKINYCCVECKTLLTFDEKIIKCSKCNIIFSQYVEGIPLFCDVDKNSKNKKILGLATKLFSSPKFYDSMIRLKACISSDAHLGIDGFVNDSFVLNIGCGSNVEADNLEYDIRKIKGFHAIDSSKEFVVAAKERCSIRNAKFSIASADKLPYADKAFDVSILAFVLHHLPFSPLIALEEAMRVSGKYVIVYDHIKSDNFFIGSIQNIYWRIFDGGFHYLTSSQWDEVLDKFQIIKKIQTGGIGKHVIKFVLERKNLVTPF